MPEQRRRQITGLEATPVVPEQSAAKPKPKPAGRPWWWYLTPAGVKNEAKYFLKQAGEMNAGYRPTGTVSTPLMAPGSMFAPVQYQDPKGRVRYSTPLERQVVHGAAVKMPTDAALAAINLAQRASNGWLPSDPASTTVGKGLVELNRTLAKAMDAKLPEEMSTYQKTWFSDIPALASASLLGGAAASRIVGPQAFSFLSPGAAKAARWVAGIGTESFLTTLITDNLTGNIANAVTPNSPLAVTPQDDRLSSSLKSLLPNAGAEVALGLGFLGLGKAVSGLAGLPNTARNLREQRIATEVSNARQQTVASGIQEEVSPGEYRFREEAQQQPPAAQPQAQTPAQARDQLVGEPAAAAVPSEPMAPGGAVLNPDAPLPQADPGVDPFFDPALPEVDAVAMGVNRLDDQRLQELANGSGPVVPEVDRHLQEQSQFEVVPGLDPAFMAMPAENLADPMVPMRQQWESTAVPTANLMSLASPENGTLLYNRVRELTGRDFEQFTRGDVLDGIDVLGQEGIALLPNRAGDGVQLFDVNAIQVDPGRFQFKGGINAQGQQIGNSLQGVSKWNTDAEGVVQVWTDPADGQTFVVNGHNRLAKAKELGVPSIRVEELPAQTAEQARAMGAISNIASGGGTAFDAAKFIRESGIQDAAQLEASGIPLSSGLGAQGLALSKLPDNLLQSAIDGELSMGRALALGGSGLDPEKMNRVYQLAQGRDMTDRAFNELAQMASSAPKVKSGQKNLFGDEELDTTVIKAELAGKIRAELIGNKNLFKRVGRGRSVKQLADKAGTEVNAQQVMDAGATAQAVLGEFDAAKYAAGTPISQMLNEAAAEVANGAKQAPIVKRILQQLEASAEVAPPAMKAEPGPASQDQQLESQWESWSPEKRQQIAQQAQAALLSERKLQSRLQYEADDKANVAQVLQYNSDMPGSNSGKELTEEQFIAKYGADESKHPKLNYAKRVTPKQLRELQDHRWAEKYLAWYESQPKLLDAAQREQLKAQVIQKAVANGEVRPSATPIPELPARPLVDPAVAAKDLEANGLTAGSPGAQAIMDEIRLGTEYAQIDARRQFEVERANREAMGYDLMPLEEKKANGMLNGWDKPDPVSLDERAAYAKQKRMEAEQAGDETLAREWRNAERQLEQSRIARSIGQQNTSQQDMFGVGQYDTTTPLLNQPQRQPFAFPADLSKSAPRYGSATLKFANDLDRAAYMLRNASKKSAGEDRLVAALEAQGYDIPAIRRHGALVNQEIKNQVKAQTGSAAAPVGKQMAVEVPDQGFGSGAMALQAVDPIRQKKERAFLMLGQTKYPPGMTGPFADSLRQIIRDVAGDHVEIKFGEYYIKGQRPAQWAGTGETSTRAGVYDPIEDVVTILGLSEGNAASVLTTAHHEAFHRIQWGLMNSGEMKAMETVFGQTRIEDYSGMARGGENPATIERMAVAYQRYAELRMQGFDNPYDELIRSSLTQYLDAQFPQAGKSWNDSLKGKVAVKVFSAFERAREVLERFSNLIKGNGFTSADDFFRRAYEGELARKREFNHALEMVTPDQVERVQFLDLWYRDNNRAQGFLNTKTAELDAQIAALKTQALSGGC